MTRRRLWTQAEQRGLYERELADQRRSAAEKAYQDALRDQGLTREQRAAERIAAEQIEWRRRTHNALNGIAFYDPSWEEREGRKPFRAAMPAPEGDPDEWELKWSSSIERLGNHGGRRI